MTYIEVSGGKSESTLQRYGYGFVTLVVMHLLQAVPWSGNTSSNGMGTRKPPNEHRQVGSTLTTDLLKGLRQRPPTSCRPGCLVANNIRED